MTINYGFETTDDIAYDKQGLPVGTYKAMAVSEEETPGGFAVEWEVVDGPFKGRKGKVWYNTTHENTTTRNIAGQAVKRIADATGKAVSASAPIVGRVLTLEVATQKKDDRYTEVKRYLPENHFSDSIPYL